MLNQNVKILWQRFGSTLVDRFDSVNAFRCDPLACLDGIAAAVCDKVCPKGRSDVLQHEQPCLNIDRLEFHRAFLSIVRPNTIVADGVAFAITNRATPEGCA